MFSSFSTLQPFETPASVTTELYKAHCIEILERVVHVNMTQDATKAEVLAVLNEQSLKGSLKQDPATLFYRLFIDIYGDYGIDMFKANETMDAYEPRESWNGACDELQGSIARRIKNYRTINYPDHLDMKEKDMPKPAKLKQLAKVLKRLDDGLREKSICDDCGKPKDGFLPVVHQATKGKVTGRVYTEGQHLLPDDAGLCSCDKPEVTDET
jgi:hypothetical protein